MMGLAGFDIDTIMKWVHQYGGRGRKMAKEELKSGRNLVELAYELLKILMEGVEAKGYREECLSLSKLIPKPLTDEEEQKITSLLDRIATKGADSNDEARKELVRIGEVAIPRIFISLLLSAERGFAEAIANTLVEFGGQALGAVLFIASWVGAKTYPVGLRLIAIRILGYLSKIDKDIVVVALTSVLDDEDVGESARWTLEKIKRWETMGVYQRSAVVEGRREEGQRGRGFDSVSGSVEAVIEALKREDVPALELRVALKAVDRELAWRSETIRSTSSYLDDTLRRGRGEGGQGFPFGTMVESLGRLMGKGELLSIAGCTIDITVVPVGQLHQLKDTLELRGGVDIDGGESRMSAEERHEGETQEMIREKEAHIKRILEFEEAKQRSLEGVTDPDMYRSIESMWNARIMDEREKMN